MTTIKWQKCSLACLLVGLAGGIPVASALEALPVAPEAGHVESTLFHFSANHALAEGQQLQLRLWSPDVNNVWAWREMPLERQGAEGDRYGLSTGLAEFSQAYRYQYQVVDSATRAVLEQSQVFEGPKLVVNEADVRSPQVLRTYPENLSIAIEPSRQLTIMFDEVIDPSTVSPDKIRVVGKTNAVQAVQAYQNRLIVTLAESLAQSYDFDQMSSSYSVDVQGISDLNGNAMVPYSFLFSVKSPTFQSFAIENGKYPGYCLTVIDQKLRFAAPQSWNPIVQLTQCKRGNSDASQRWFLGAAPGSGQYAQVRWSYNHHYCLSKPAVGNPALVRCDNQDERQLFRLRSVGGPVVIEAKTGGCVASGVVDVGGINKVESSLCLAGLSRNQWSVAGTGWRELTEPVMLGKFDIRYADIQYINPVKGVKLTQDQTRDLVKAMYNTHALNQGEIYQRLQLQEGAAKGEGFLTANPYFPRYTGNDIPLPKPRSAVVNGVEVQNPEGYEDTQEGYHYTDQGIEYFSQQPVARWFSEVTRGGAASREVCAIKFVDGNNYQMQTFPSLDEAVQAGWKVTHQYHCGVCSTLKDLAVYMGVKDQTTPVRLCTKRGQAQNGKLDEVKQCIQESVGFTEMCAEAWAYNGIHTGQQCQGTCLATYGNDALFWPAFNGFIDMVIREKFNACPTQVPSNDPYFRAQMQAAGCPLKNEQNGKLNDCLWCDERISGPGFKYDAARTRRASGLESEIPRPNDRLFYEADHTAYFR